MRICVRSSFISTRGSFIITPSEEEMNLNLLQRSNNLSDHGIACSCGQLLYQFIRQLACISSRAVRILNADGVIHVRDSLTCIRRIGYRW